MLVYARKSGLEVIPLVQTFGHLEFALKLPEFRHFRELSAFPQEICPSNPDAFRVLVRELIEQVMSLHPTAKWLHIGCDEVFHLAACARCTSRKLDSRYSVAVMVSHRLPVLAAVIQGVLSRRLLFTEHVIRVARFVRGRYPGVTPLVWDDMLRHWLPVHLADSGLGELVEPVVWVYNEDIARQLPHYTWYMYGRVFLHVWVASAYKGAYGATALAPDLRRHSENNLAWLRILRSTKGVRFRGMVLTGWARYDHFAVLCELLPVSVPSLLLNLLLVSHPPWSKSQVIVVWTHALACPLAFTPGDSFDSDPFQWHLGACEFPGSNLFSAVANYVTLQAQVDSLYTDMTQRHGWLTTYNVRHNFSSPWRLLDAQAHSQRLLRDLNAFRNSTELIMAQYFDRFTVDEWLEQKVDSITDKILSLQKIIQALVTRDTWQRRPIS